MTQKHTATPWEIESHRGSCSRGVGINAGDSAVVSVECNDCIGNDERLTEADARFIVQACNAHDDLLAACELGLRFMEAWDGDHSLDEWPGSRRDCQQVLRAAITKATSPQAPGPGQGGGYMTHQHTPGPWQCATQGHAWLVTRMPIGEWLAEINREMPEDEAQANAHLIAAAPDLLAALEDALPFIGYTTPSSETLRSQAEAAITKATSPQAPGPGQGGKP